MTKYAEHAQCDCFCELEKSGKTKISVSNRHLAFCTTCIKEGTIINVNRLHNHSMISNMKVLVLAYNKFSLHFNPRIKTIQLYVVFAIVIVIEVTKASSNHLGTSNCVV